MTDPDYSPQAETATGAISNALQICDTWERRGIALDERVEARSDFAAVARLLRDALGKLEAK